MIDKIVERNKCFGCESCANICPKKAIKMEEDSFGFDFPTVDYSLCIKCGLCKKVCPSINKYQGKPTIPLLYSTRIIDNKALFSSTSGGFFTAVSDYILKNNGCISGAVFDEDFSVKHLISNTSDERNKMRGAKYVKSKIGNCFKTIRDLLNDGRIVLFTGTPCQVHGLKLFLEKEYDNLFTIDILCHGVPSNKYYRDFLAFLEKKHGSISSIQFRSKKNGWHGNNLQVSFQNGEILLNTNETKKYTTYYGSGLLMRENCFECPYTTIFRIGDFSMGDCWGIENTKSSFADNKGCSLVFLNTKKGELLFNQIKDSLLIEHRDMFEILQHNLIHPTLKPKKYDSFKCKTVDKNYWDKIR